MANVPMGEWFMRWPAHFAVGLAASVLPDVALLIGVTASKGKWLDERHPALRVHRWLHSAQGLVITAWTLHVVLDWFTHKPSGFWPRKDRE